MGVLGRCCSGGVRSRDRFKIRRGVLIAPRPLCFSQFHGCRDYATRMGISGNLQILEPVEGVFGFGGWVVFGAGPSFVSELVEFFEDE